MMRNILAPHWRGRGVILLVLIGFGIGFNAWKLFRGNTLVRQLWAAAMPGAKAFPFPTRSVDALYVDEPQRGNVFFRYASATPEDSGFLSDVYCRSAYLLFPRKIFAVPPGTVVNRGRDLLHDPLSPSEAWLDEHEVTLTVNYTRAADGKVDYQKIIRSPP